jgi:hypothetical protein
LNCVLQGLVNTPGVRDYFLGDYHNRHRCRLKREQERGEQRETVEAHGDGRAETRRVDETKRPVSEDRPGSEKLRSDT